MTSLPCTVRRLAWADQPLAVVDLPGGTMTLTIGLGSGLARRRGEPPGRVWAICDRGPNLKAKAAIELYGLTAAESLRGLKGAKIMPLPAFAPALFELQAGEDAVSLVRTLRLVTQDGASLSGLPPPGGVEAAMEPVFELAALPLGVDPLGADPEAVAALSDGGFWVAEEYGPSLFRVAPDGRILRRWVPQGAAGRFAHPGFAVEDVLPAAAADRRLNRGFEALALSGDERRLFAVLQSAASGQAAREVPIWTLDADTGALLAEHLYRFDEPASFRRDAEAGPVEGDDLKICELVWLGTDRLMVLERISQTAKLYEASLTAGGGVEKRLLFSTDDHRQVAADLEGVALLDARTLLLVNDNDFGVEGAETRFFTVRFEADLAGG